MLAGAVLLVKQDDQTVSTRTVVRHADEQETAYSGFTGQAYRDSTRGGRRDVPHDIETLVGLWNNTGANDPGLGIQQLKIIHRASIQELCQVLSDVQWAIEGNRSVRVAMFQRLAGLDLGEALDGVMLGHHCDIRAAALSGIIGDWVTKDPLSAIDWSGKLEDPELRDASFAMMSNQLATRDVISAINLAMQISDESLRQQMSEAAVSHWVKQEPGEALEWMASLEDGVLRHSIEQKSILELAASKQGERAADYLICHMSGNPEVEALAIGIAHRWAVYQPEKAVDWVERDFGGDSAPCAKALRGIFRLWLMQNRKSAEHWLIEHPDNEFRDMAMVAYEHALKDTRMGEEATDD